MAEIYDPDDALNRSPPPEPQKINYRVVKTPPPYIPSRSPSPQNKLPGHLRKSSRPREELDSASLGGAMLIAATEPNRPDFVRWELEEGSRGRETIDFAGNEESDIKDTSAIAIAQDAQLAQDALRVLQEEKPTSESLASPPAPSLVKVEDREDVNLRTFNPRKDADNISGEPGRSERGEGREEDEKPGLPKYSPQAEGPFLHGRTSCEAIPRIEPSATSPNQREFGVSQSSLSQPPTTEAPPVTQPVPLPVPNFSGPIQTLPSIESTLGTQLKNLPMKDPTNAVNGTQHSYPPGPGSSPPLNTQQHTSTKQESQQLTPYSPPQIPPPYSQATPPGSKDMPSFSPPSMPGGTHPSYWRAPPKSESSYITSPFDPGSVGSQMGHSPSTGYPTPTDPMTPNETERSNTINKRPQPNGPLTSSGFKCAHPGCQAPPFQTQYLLK